MLITSDTHTPTHKLTLSHYTQHIISSYLPSNPSNQISFSVFYEKRLCERVIVEWVTMTNCTEENNVGASSSTTPTEVAQDSSVFDNSALMNLELSNINEEDLRIIRRLKIRGPPNIHMTNEVDDHSISVDEKGCFLYLILIIFMYVCENLFFFLPVACQKWK